MTYLVLLEFEDEEQALNFAESGLEGRLFATDVNTNMWRVRSTEVKAIYKKPTMFCQGCSGGRRGGASFTRGQKWGWWVCSVCSKPSELYWESVIEKQSSFGFNLLDRLFTKEN